jgi:tRNA A-37 threonylcarbamoyl transferase component Bud32
MTSTTTTPDLIFGKYALIRRLALGGMGEVFLAQQTGGVAGTERLAILKSLLPELAAQDGFIDQFLDEARVAAKLNHPNIVQMFEAGLWNGVYFIAMEYIRGENLSRIAKTARSRGVKIPLHVLVRIVRDALLGLGHAHTAHDEMTGAPLGVVHRDVSPQNIMVRMDGVTKVVDFGIAKAGNKSSRTATGVLKGKLQYMAPEQVQGEAVDARTDQFAMGVVLWELVTDARLFEGDNEIQLLKAVLVQPIPKPSLYAPGLPHDLEATILRMLSRDPAGRFASCEDAADALTAWLNTGSRRVTEAEVAGWIKEIVGEAVDETTRNLAPTGDNFVLGLHGANAGVVRSIPPSTPGTQPTFVRQLEHRRRATVAVAAGTIAAVALVGIVGAVALSLREPTAAADTTEPAAAAATAARSVTPAAPTVVAQAPAIADDGVSVELTAPVGARVLVDDREQPGRLPTTLRGLTPGPHKIVVVTDDGTKIDVPYAPPAPRLVVTTTPPAAAVTIDGAPLGLTPLSTDRVPPGNHELVLRLDGHKLVKERVGDLQAGEARSLSWTLEKLTPREPPDQPSPPPPPPPTTECFGALTLDTTPWSKVTIDGDPYGTTPLFVRRIKGGSHKVVFENEAEGIKATRTITTKCDEPVKLKFPLK